MYVEKKSCLSEEKQKAGIRFNEPATNFATRRKMYKPVEKRYDYTRVDHDSSAKSRLKRVEYYHQVSLSSGWFAVPLLWAWACLKVPLLPTGTCSYSSSSTTLTLDGSKLYVVYVPARTHQVCV